MKTPNDTSTLDMLPNGAPAFDLDPEDAWPTPSPLPEWMPKQEAEPTLREWLTKILFNRKQNPIPAQTSTGLLTTNESDFKHG